MVCPYCGKNAKGEGPCRTCSIKQRVKSLKSCSPWVAIASNKMLPPIVFFAISLLALTAAASLDSGVVRVNLAVASAFSSAVGLYIINS